MNKLLMDLVEQATTDVTYRYQTWGNTIGTSHEEVFDKEKFAMMIVRECMTTILKESKWYWDKDEFESSNAIQNAARRVQERFGIEGFEE